jgi:hypothetical protein
LRVESSHVAVALVVNYESSAKIAEPTAAVISLSAASSPVLEPMEQESTFTRALMHKSGYYFFCPYCSLSFQHPPWLEHFYRVGYGWCWYCARWTPIEGGDKKGIVKVDEKGELYTSYYEAKDEERETQRARRVLELSGTKVAQRE